MGPLSAVGVMWPRPIGVKGRKEMGERGFFARSPRGLGLPKFSTRSRFSIQRGSVPGFLRSLGCRVLPSSSGILARGGRVSTIF